MNISQFLIAVTFFCFCLSIKAQAKDNPVANRAAVVIAGNARFTVLTPELIRMEWSEDGKFEDRASLIFINRDLQLPSFKKTYSGGWLKITTDKLSLTYKPSAGMFNNKNLKVSLILNEKEVTWEPGKKDSLNLRGTTRTLDGANGDRGGWDKKVRQLEDGIISRSGWALVQDTMPLFDGDSDWNWVTERNASKHQDWYFFGYGHNYAKALADFTQVAGKIPMPPRFAFGYWWCRYWSYSDSEMRDLVTQMKQNNIPVDVAIIDMDWHRTDGLSTRNGWNNAPKDIMGQMKDWGGYTWNKELFPQPEKFLSWMDKQQVKNALNIHPASGILNYDAYYPAIAKALNLDTTKATPYNKSFGKISGWDTISVGNNIPWDITNKKFAKAYFDVIIHDLEKQGIDFWWLDWQQWFNTPVKGLNNTWWLNYCFYTDMERNRTERPILFHRWGGLGNHRYQLGFSGDTFSSWKSLDFQKYFTATAANVGYGYWSHDIGGHILHADYTPELYTRWIQYGIFSPVLRTHGTKRPETDRRIWAYPYTDFVEMKKAIDLRYALLPYIYTAARNTYDTGLSICLPLYYKHPEKEKAYQSRQMYYFGDDIIASPVTDSIRSSNMLAPAKIWLPEGEWFDYYNGEMLKGNKSYERGYSLSQIPVFMKAGSIIPMYPHIPNTQNIPITLILTVVPGSNGNMRFYDDAGNDKNYIDDNYCWIRAEQITDGNCVQIKIHKPEGKYNTHVKNYTIRLLNTLPPVKAVYNDIQLHWDYNAQSLSTDIQIPDFDMTSDGLVTVLFKENVSKTQQELNGLKGRLDALNEIIPKIKAALGAVDVGPMASRINILSQTATRIEYNPENAGEELKNFAAGFLQIEKSIKTMKLDEKRINSIINRLKNCYIPKPAIEIQGTFSPIRPAKVALVNVGGEGIIHYTLDGTMPGKSSAVYSGPFTVTEKSLLKAVCILDSAVSEVAEKELIINQVKADITCNVTPMENFFPMHDFGVLMDNEVGDPNANGDKWIGFDRNFTLTVDLKKTQNLHEIKVGFAQDKWTVVLPSAVEVFVSTDGKKYRLAGKISPDFNEAINQYRIFREEISVPLNKVNGRFIQIRFKTAGKLPENHTTNPGAGSMIFIDEIKLL